MWGIVFMFTFLAEQVPPGAGERAEKVRIPAKGEKVLIPGYWDKYEELLQQGKIKTWEQWEDEESPEWITIKGRVEILQRELPWLKDSLQLPIRYFQLCVKWPWGIENAVLCGKDGTFVGKAPVSALETYRSERLS